jgi:hypothetical protein
MFDKFLPWLVAVVVALGTSAHSAHASGTVSKQNYYEWYTSQCATKWYTSLSELQTCTNAAFATQYGKQGTSTITGTNPPVNNSSQFHWISNDLSIGVYSTINTQFYQSACPVNSTGTTTCTCTDPYIPNSGATACVMPPCPATGTVYSVGYYDLGTVDNPNNHPPLNSCDSGCSTSYDGGAQAYRSLVGGVYHYYSKGGYYNDSSISGGACTGGTPSTGASSSLPVDTCGSGQSLVTGSNGYAKCFNDSTGDVVDSNSTAGASAVAAAQTAAQQAAGAAAQQAASNAVQAAGGTTQQQTDAGMAAAGTAAGQVAADQAAQKAYCDQNPSALQCMSLGSIPSLDAIPSSTPTFSAASVSFAAVAGCPAPQTFTLTMPHLAGTYSISWQPFCDFGATIRPVFLALAAIAAAFIFAAGLSI